MTAIRKARRVTGERRVKLFRNGRSQALRIPKEFELPGDEAVLRREGDRLVVEPARKLTLLELLDTFDTIDEPFEIPEPEMPLDDIEL